jgi:exosortase/archaeosortase family protein
MILSVVLFIGAVAAFFWVFNNNWVIDHVLNPYTSVLVTVTVALFHAAGSNAVALGQSISVNGTAVTVATGCNGTEALSLFSAAIVAVPTRISCKLVGLAMGLVGILIANEIRIIGLVLVAVWRPDFLFEAHNYIGQTFVIVVGMAIWIYWARQYATVPASGTY